MNRHKLTKVLILEDQYADAEFAKMEIRKFIDNLEFLTVDNENDFRSALSDFTPDLIISDFSLPSFNGLEAIEIVREKDLFMPLVVFTGSIDEDTAVSCMKLGADDYVLKQYSKRLGPAVVNAMRRKELEKESYSNQIALQENEEKYRQLFAKANDAIFLMKDGKFIDCNPKAIEMYHCNKSDILKASPYNLSPEYQSDGSLSKVSSENKMNAVINGEPQFFEWIHKRYDGTPFYVEVSLNKLILLGQTYIQAVVRDVSERKEAEQKIKDALEKATEADRLKTAFLANMSHEIRTPMNGIIGFARLLKTPDISVDELHKYVGIIEKSGNRMLETINNLIDISKIEADQMEVINGDVDVNQILTELFNFFKAECDKKGLLLKLKVDENISSLIINSDEIKLIAILSNLIKNAIKYTPNGAVEIGYNTDSENIIFFVNDSGIGIPEERQKAIFDRFVQADIEDKCVFEGSGLGLSISKAYVTMLNGTIDLISKVNQGSSFIVKIPIVKS